MNLRDAAFILTGGSRGIGRATAALLISHGANVVITGRNEEALNRAASEIGATPVAADVSNPDDVKRTYKLFFEKFEVLHGLVNNAGFGAFAALTDLEPEEFQRVWAVNVLGPTLMAKEAALAFKLQQHGNIINIASTAALRGVEQGSAYVASKFALRGLAECWRAELRPFNVRVTTIYPSEVTTVFGSDTDTARDPADKPNRLRPAEIAHAVVAALQMDDRGFIPDLSVYATNPW